LGGNDAACREGAATSRASRGAINEEEARSGREICIDATAASAWSDLSMYNEGWRSWIGRESGRKAASTWEIGEVSMTFTTSS